MAKYKDYSYDQGVFLPVFFDKQILPGTFECQSACKIDPFPEFPTQFLYFLFNKTVAKTAGLVYFAQAAA